MSNTEFEIITFDCYGTLIDWESGITGAFISEASRDGVELTPERVIEAYMEEEPSIESGRYISYKDVLGQAARRVAARLGWSLPPERTSFLADSLPNWRPFPDTNASLERLARRYRLGILSNIDDELLEKTLRLLTVSFDLIVTAEQVKSYKPGFAHFNEAGRRIGGARQLHAAQSYFHDVVPARALHIPVVWVNRKGEQPAPGGPLPTKEVGDLAALADFLDA
ncbi:MAG TPA: HAD family hydrolase [Blastocatellia bacterium]|jgi:2-haloacid dehalogenase/putative hydrolase of the HAD superfamily|nr:HAD family hydrolase [Blastocatellia bacterium]